MNRFKVIQQGSLLLAMLVVTPNLHADNRAAAAALFHAGSAAVKRGDVREGCAKFRESHRLDAAAVETRLSLAVCEDELGQLALSWQLLTSLMKSLPAADPRLAEVRKRLSNLESRLPRVTFQAAERLPPGITVRAGELEIGESGFGVPIPLDPGKYSFDVAAPGFVSARYELTLTEGNTKTVLIMSPRAEAVTASRPAAAPSPRSVSRGVGTQPASHRQPRAGSVRTWITILNFGGAGMALATGIATGLAALERKETMADACDQSGCSDAGLQAARSGNTLARVSTASFITGVALAGTGTLLLISAPASQRPSGATSIQVALSGGGLVVRGRL